VASQLPLFSASHPLADELEALQIDQLTPLEALNLLYEWRQRLKQQGG
jgi:DNA mismatch repair protein MutS